MITLWGMSGSGNCHKLRLTCEVLRIPYTWHEVDILTGITRGPDFLALNPNGKVPAARLEDGTLLAESNAIMHYLADGSPLLPSGRLERAQILQWLFFEQYSHEPYIATARFLLVFKLPHASDPESVRRQAEEKWKGGYRALDVMEQQLAARPWFAAGRFTIADIGLYAYTHVAHEGGFDLAPYPAVRAWLDRVREQPGVIPMPA